MRLSWKPDVQGVIVQDFELWRRPLSSTEYDWTSSSFRQSGNESADFNEKTIAGYFIRLRGKNDQGFGPFSSEYTVFGNKSILKNKESIIGKGMSVFLDI